MVFTSRYPIVSVAVDVVAFTLVDNRLSVLLIEREDDGLLALPGGFVRPDEDLEAAAHRELAEETGVEHPVLEQLATYGDPDRDPRQRVVSVAHLAVLPRLVEPTSGTDARAAMWRPVDTVAGLAFDHDRILADALERLGSKLEYTAIATGFLPDRFTLAELRSVYETVWGRPLDPGNFQRKMTVGCTDFVAATDDTRPPEGRGRPARLFRALKTGTAPLASPVIRGSV